VQCDRDLSQSECTAIAKGLYGDCKRIIEQLQGDCTPIEKQLHIDCTAIAKIDAEQLLSNCSAFAKRS
jgi:hypothetical protein